MKILDVEIERVLPGGQGLAHAEGLTLFIPLSARGDKLRVEVTRIKGRTGFGTIKEILQPSPDRVEPPCPYFGRCGGCDFQQLTYSAQLIAKVEIIRDCLFRIGRIKNVPTIHITPSPREWQYRSRANWQIDTEHRRFGYLEGGTHNVCDVEFCAVLAPELKTVFETVRRTIRDEALDDSKREINAVCGDDAVSVAPPIAGFHTANVSRNVGVYRYWYDAKSFFQISEDLLEQLIRQALPKRIVSAPLALDLYCGVGLFSLPLAERFEQVIGVESNPLAVRFARRNLMEAGFENVGINTARVGDWLLTNDLPPVNLILLDPPRTGAEPSAIEGILKIRPEQISYVSCDPATLARDLKLLIAGGYRLVDVSAFDMFPQTHHVESVAHLTRV